MSTKKFVIECKLPVSGEKDRYQIRTKDRSGHTKVKIELRRLGPNGWHCLETESVTDDQSERSVIKKLIGRIGRLYGSPDPTKIIPYDSVVTTNPNRLKEQYGIDSIDATEATVIEDE